MEGKYYDDARQALDETPDVPLHLRLVEPLPRSSRASRCRMVRSSER
jgi:hypothetical protein